MSNSDSHFSSVKRQLNLYGFRLNQRGEYKGYFFQPNFRRDDMLAAQAIARVATPKKKRVNNSSISKTSKRPRSNDVNDIHDGTSDTDSESESEESDKNANLNGSKCEGNIRQSSLTSRLGVDLKGVNLKLNTVFPQASSNPVDNSGHLIQNFRSNPNVGQPRPYNFNDIVMQAGLLALAEPTLRPSVLSSRLGFDLASLRKNASLQRSVLSTVTHDYVQQPPTHQPKTYENIDEPECDLYKIGPPSNPLNDFCMNNPQFFESQYTTGPPSASAADSVLQTEGKSMILLPVGGDKSSATDSIHRSVSIDDMMEFLGHL